MTRLLDVLPPEERRLVKAALDRAVETVGLPEADHLFRTAVRALAGGGARLALGLTAWLVGDAPVPKVLKVGGAALALGTGDDPPAWKLVAGQMLRIDAPGGSGAPLEMTVYRREGPRPVEAATATGTGRVELPVDDQFGAEGVVVVSDGTGEHATFDYRVG